MVLCTEIDDTMMTDVVVAPSLGGLVIGCMLLLTGTVCMAKSDIEL